MDADLASWLTGIGIAEVDRLPQMVAGSALSSVDLTKRYALASQALG